MRDRVVGWHIFDGTGRRKYLNARERTLFLEEADKLNDDRRALCRLLALTGCRVSEALALTSDHIDTERSVVTFRTLKRRRLAFRSVPIPEKLCADLAVLGQGRERLWSIHRSTAWRLVHELAQRCAIDGPMACPRGLRHSFGIHAATSNVPPNLVQRFMGHASLTTTAIYLDAVDHEERAFASRMW